MTADRKTLEGPMMEHEAEPVPGLPEHLPQGERVLLQTRPNWRAFALRALHVRAVAIYFGLLMAWRIASGLADGGSFSEIAVSAAWICVPALLLLGLLFGYARLVQRTTLYTITSKRVVMRYGMAIPKAVNIPFRIIGSAGLRTAPDGTGDIPLSLLGPDKIAYLHLWPHARPWRLGTPEPMLRSLPDAGHVASELAEALAAESNARMQTAPHGAAGGKAPVMRPGLAAAQ